MISIVDYGMGNLRSVQKGFESVGFSARITSNPKDILDSAGIVLPGVGAFGAGMAQLDRLGLIDSILKSARKDKPILGICLGLQLLFSESEEGDRVKGLDVFRGKIKRFSFNGIGERDLKIPHMGWNTVYKDRESNMLDGIEDGDYFYFVHSYYVEPVDRSLVVTHTTYGIEFASSIEQGNIFACQFHLEKSQSAGLKVLSNFGKLCK